QMYAMAEQAPATDKSVALVDPRIVGAIRIELPGERDLRMVFAEMCLHVAVRIFRGERPRHFELFRRGGDGEAGRDGIEPAPAPVPAADEALGFIVARCRCI